MSMWSALLGVMPMLNRQRTSAPADPSGPVIFFGRTPAGIHVDADSMLKNPVVWACCQYLTKTVGQLPWRVLKPKEGGGNELAVTNQVDWLLHKRPNPEMGAMTFRMVLLLAALTRGNGYAEIQRDNRGVPIALWPLATDRVTPKRADSRHPRFPAGMLFYRVQNDGVYVDMDAMDIFHLRGFPGPDGVVGLDVVTYAAQTVGWAQAAELFGATFFGEGMNPAGVVEVDTSLKTEGLERIRKQFVDMFKGPRKANRTAFLDKGMKWTRITTRPDEAQFIETMQHQVETICRFFGVPPHKVQHMLRSTFSNIEHQSIEVVVDSIAPWARLFEEEADYKLFGATNRQGFYTKIYLQGLMRGDAKSRAEFYKLMFETGAFSPNMILELEDRNPIGPEGDKHMVQSQYTTLERVGEEPLEGSSDASSTPDTEEDDTEEDDSNDGDEAAADPARGNRRKISKKGKK